jgi:hypothetical protein
MLDHACPIRASPCRNRLYTGASHRLSQRPSLRDDLVLGVGDVEESYSGGYDLEKG